MDYELKYVIAICLIVKIAAVSGEFSTAREESENPEQSPGRAEASLLPSSAAQATPARRPKPFGWGPGEGKFNSVKSGNLEGVAKSKKIKENQSFDTCEHKLELLESSLKWRDIRKTLRWLDRMLASNQTSICHRRKEPKRRPRFHAKIKHFELQSKNKKSTSPKLDWTRRNSKMTTHSIRSKILRKVRKHKHSTWRNRLRMEWKKKEKLKNEWKEPGFGKYFPKKNVPIFSPDNAPSLNKTILKPNSDVEPIFFQRTENKGENNFKNHHPFSNSLIEQCKGVKCGEEKAKERPVWGTQAGGKWSGKVKSRERDQKAKMPQQKPWPHFVYHRVSSNFLHPDSTNQNHRQSAYIAISVVTSSKPDSTDNNDVV